MNQASIKLSLVSLWDTTKLSLAGTIHVLTRWQYLLLAVAIAHLIGIAFSIFATGTTDWNMLVSSIPLADKTAIIGRVATDMYANTSTFAGAVIALVAILQGIALALLAYNIKQQYRVKSLQNTSAANAKQPALATFIAALGLGCSTCGTSLLLPLFGTLAGSALFLTTLTVLVAVIAIGLLAYSSWKMGYSAYMFISLESKGA